MRALIVIGLATLWLAACSKDEDGFASYRLLSMGTWVDLSVPKDVAGSDADLLRDIEAHLRAFERDYYAWGDGELAELNRELTRSRSFDASPAMAGLLARAKTISATSDGAFDPGVGALVELWGFNVPEPTIDSPPSAAEIDAVLAASASIGDLGLDGTRISVEAGQVTIDLGGIAKGQVVDDIVEMLIDRGVETALVNAGGDLRVIGQPTGRPWRIGIQAPRDDGLLGTVTIMHGEAVFSSGDYERYVDYRGDRLHHIIDPRSGKPVSHTQAVTVMAADGVTADAAATALFVAGPDRWRSMAENLGIEAALRVDASGDIEMTTVMRERIQISAGAASDIIAAGTITH